MAWYVDLNHHDAQLAVTNMPSARRRQFTISTCCWDSSRLNSNQIVMVPHSPHHQKRNSSPLYEDFRSSSFGETRSHQNWISSPANTVHCLRISSIRSISIGLLMTFFRFFDVPVFWPILVIYWFLLFTVTMKRQIAHMIKYRYVPFTWGKKVRIPGLLCERACLMTFLDPPCRNMEEVEKSPEKTHHDILDLMRAAAYSFQFG